MNRKTVTGVALALVLAVGGYLLYTKVWKSSGAKEETAEKPKDPIDLSAANSKSSPGGAPERPPLAMDDDPEGPLRLEGQVIDDAGVGVAGAVVTLSSNPPRNARAEDDGTFAFEKLIGRTYFLSARSGALVGGPQPYKLTGEGQPAIIRMHAGGSVTVTVKSDATGDPVSGATVELRESEVRTEETNGEGVATFAGVGSGWFVAVARAPGYGTARQAVSMPSTPGATMKVDLALAPGFSVSGRVTGEGGAPLAGATVAAYRVGQFFEGIDPRHDGVKTDAAGAFMLDGVRAGKVQIAATHPDYAPSRSEVLDLADDASGVEIALERGGLVSGRVITAAGVAVPWATVAVRAKGDGSMWGGGNRGTTADADGAFELKGLPRAELNLLASSDEAASDLVAVDLVKVESVTSLDVVLSITGTISGKVVNQSGEELAEVQVVLHPDWTSGVDTERVMLRFSDTTTTAGDGSFKFTGLADGVFMLKPTRDSGSQMIWQLEGKRAKTGDSGIELVLPNNGGIKGRVVDASGAPVRGFTVTVGWPPGHPFANDDGSFDLSAIPPGKYDIKIRGEEFAETSVRDVEVRADKTTDTGEVKVARGRQIKGRVVDSRGSGVAGALVMTAPQLMGSSDSLSISPDATTDEMMGTRRATTDDDGYYRLRGVSAREAVVAAEHKEYGRSRPTLIPKSGAEAAVNLTLIGVGTIKGVVKRGDTPAPGANVVATPSETRLQLVLAQTDAKGEFSLSGLAVGNYEVSALFGGGLTQQGVTKSVVVKEGDARQLDLVFDAGEVTLKVTVTPKPGATVDATQLFVFPGAVAVSNGKEVNDAFLGKESSGAAMAFSMKGAIVEFTELTAGAKTLCGIPITGDMNNTQFMQRLQEHGSELEVVCMPVTIAESPLKQAIELVVPQMKPLPDPERQDSPTN